jgi:hypothetical protein
MIRTKITKAAANAIKAWSRRFEEHPLIIAALAERNVISESWAKTVTGWTGKLPEEHVQEADQIMVTAAKAGADLEGLARIFAELLALLAPPDTDPEKGPDRSLRLETTFDGAGILHGDLSPRCAAVVKTVLDALAIRRDGDDTRSPGERYHDALEEAMTRLLAAGTLPPRRGKPLTALVHINFADLIARDRDSELEQAWIKGTAAQWAAERAGAHVQPGDGGTWLDGPEAAAAACDATLIPVVTGNVDISVLDDLVELCVEYHQLRQQAETDPGDQDTGDGQAPRFTPDRGAHAARLAELEAAIVGKTIGLVSGPGGLASFLRRHALGAGLAGPSLVLDVGDTDHIPWQIRTAVAVRDQHCAWPGGCDQPAEACEPHHTIPRAQHGKTSIGKLGLYCWWHHHIVIHTWGWTVTINPDGTMTARKPDGTLFAHSPPPPVNQAER